MIFVNLQRINAHPKLSKLVTAAGVNTNTGISLTVIPADTTIDVGLSGIISQATLDETGNATTVAAVFGSGTSAQVAALWTEFSSEQMGNSNQLYMQNQFFTFANPAVAATNYDLYNITMRRDVPNSVGVAMGSANMEVGLAVPVSATFQATLNTILGLINL